MTYSKLLAVLVLFSVAGIFTPAYGQKPRWLTTHSWKGTGTAATEIFWVNTNRWRIRYAPHGRGIFHVALYNVKGELVDVVADLERPVSGLRTQTGKGQCYLTVTAIDTRWEISVEQYLSVIEEWQLLQRMKQPPVELAKLAEWTGGTGDAEYELTVPAGSWKVVHTNKGNGLLQVKVQNDEGLVSLAANNSSTGEGESWVHAAGTFTVSVVAVDTTWKVVVYGENPPEPEPETPAE